MTVVNANQTVVVGDVNSLTAELESSRNSPASPQPSSNLTDAEAGQPVSQAANVIQDNPEAPSWDEIAQALRDIAARNATAKTTPEPEPFSVRKKVRSLFLLSMAIFLLGNACLSFAAPFRFDPYKFSYRGWAWWIMDDLRKDPHAHNVAVLGSSIMCSAVAGCDANFLNSPLDLTNYHRVAYLDQQLKQTYGGNFNTFNLAAPGQMPSDAYLYLKAMTETANRPDVVIYGVAPRDFIDSTLQGPNDTEPFHYLSRLVNVSNVANAEFRSVWAKLDWCMQQLLFMYGYSLDMRLAAGEIAEKTINKLIPKPYAQLPFTWWHRVRMLPTYLPGDISPGAMIAAPLSADKVTFTDNSVEYRRRYKDPDPETFRTQMHFLRKLTEYCQRERIELILVNMPITMWNAGLLDAGAYHKYLLQLRQFAWNHNVVFYDLCNFPSYTNADFHDTVHLNAFGGKKFFDNLLASLRTDFRASTMLSIAGIELEKRNAIAREHPLMPIPIATPNIPLIRPSKRTM
jgi:hypothetical protein